MDVPNNFPTEHRRPQPDTDVRVVHRDSDTLREGGGIAIEVDRRFSGWVREGQAAQVLALEGGLPRSGRITQITRVFEWRLGGGECCEGTVEIF